MRKMLILAAVAALSAACHNRNEEETGAAPNRGDTTAVTHAIDSTRTGPPGVAGRPGNATVTPDSVGIDSAAVQQNAGTAESTVTSPPTDTLGPRDTGTPTDTSRVTDTTSVRSDTAGTSR
jgi:type IV pilus biogenesis protein CpaD/CtpE